MCDSFNMACRDASNALQLNIKVNSENLLPTAQKYNVGSLRLPADPSWPKIPQRKLADDLDDIIKPGCTVTLDGTSMKSRTTVRPSNSHQSSRSSNFPKDAASFHQSIYQKISPVGHPIKRRPGCADPRFKKVTTVKSQMTSTDPNDRERDNHTELSKSAVVIPNQTQSTNENIRKTVPEKDTDRPKVTHEEAEKPGELKGMDSVGIQTTPIGDSKFENVQDLKKFTDHGENSDKPTDIEKKDETFEKKCDQLEKLSMTKDSNEPEVEKVNIVKEEGSVLKAATIAANENPGNVSQGDSPCLQYCQANNTGQFILVVENKGQASSLGTLKLDANAAPSSGQYTTQCYNVQVPVLSYQNLPLQISTRQLPKVDISSQLSLSSVLTIPSTPTVDKKGNDILNDNQDKSELSKGIFSRLSKVPESLTKETIDENVKIGQPIRDTINSNGDANVSHGKEEREEFLPELQARETRKPLTAPSVMIERKFDLNRSKIDTDATCFEASRTQQMLSDTTDSEIYGIATNKFKTTRCPRLCSKETSVSGSDYDANPPEKFRDIEPNLAKKKIRNLYYRSSATSPGISYSRNYENNLSRRNGESSMEDKEFIKPPIDTDTKANRKMKSEQNLPCSSRFSSTKNYKNISDPHITTKEISRSQDGCLCARRNKTDDRRNDFAIPNESSNNENNDMTTDDSDIANVPKFCETERTEISNVEETNKRFTSANGTTDLPVKTQQLLNKSYMEYYDKLRSTSLTGSEPRQQQRYVSQMALGTAQMKKYRPDTITDSEKSVDEKSPKPEILTMEKLSALSNIINRNLNPALGNSSDTMQTKQLYVNENMKSSSDPLGLTSSVFQTRNNANNNCPNLYDSSLVSLTLDNKVKRKREKPSERRLLKLKTIAFFGFMMYAMIVLLPMMYTYFLYDEYEDYEDLSYIELLLDYVISSFREAFGGIFEAINEIFFRPVSHDRLN